MIENRDYPPLITTTGRPEQCWYMTRWIDQANQESWGICLPSHCSDVKLTNHFYQFYLNILLFAKVILHLATSIVKDHFRRKIKTCKVFDSINRATAIKTRFLLNRERVVLRDHVSKTMKKQPVSQLYRQTKFFLWLLQYVFFSATSPKTYLKETCSIQLTTFITR